MMPNLKTIAGIEFEAVRVLTPRPHWRAKVVKTGVIHDAGVFDSSTKANLWWSIAHTASLIGHERFARESLQAK